MTQDQDAADEALRDAGLEAYRAEFRALLRRDWAVRVLDAWAACFESGAWRASITQVSRGDGEAKAGDWMCLLENCRDASKDIRKYGATPDDARNAAAHAVFPTLPEAVRAELGECP